jgi:hypothetical protein
MNRFLPLNRNGKEVTKKTPRTKAVIKSLGDKVVMVLAHLADSLTWLDLPVHFGSMTLKNIVFIATVCVH